MTLLSEHVCYFDDSFDEQIHVVGGYLAPSEIWEQVFAPAWQKVIGNAPHPISEFKSSDSRVRRGEFASWTVGEVEDLISQLISVILSTPLYAAVSAAFIWPGNPDPSSPKATRWRKQAAREGYKQCIRFCLGNAISLSNYLPETEKIRLVFDNRVKFFQSMHVSFNKVMHIIGPELARKVKPPVMSDSEEVAPLQAADLLAHQTFKEVVARMKDSPPQQYFGEVGGRPHTLYVCLHRNALARQRRYWRASDERARADIVQAREAPARSRPLGMLIKRPRPFWGDVDQQSNDRMLCQSSWSLGCV